MRASTGTIAGSEAAVGTLIRELRDGALFGGRLDHLELNSQAPRKCRSGA